MIKGEQLDEIYQGFKNIIFKDEKIEEEAERRLQICFKCPHVKNTKCGKCGCLLKAKTRSPKSKCPDNRW